MTGPQHLGPLEVRYLDFSPQLPMTGIFLFDRPRCGGQLPTFEQILQLAERRIGSVPQLSRRLRRLPRDIGPPVWEPVEIDLRDHVLRHPLPVGDGPGGSRPLALPDLESLAAGELYRELDERRPLWRIRVVEQVEGDRMALVISAHHVLSDGTEGLALAAGLLFSVSPGTGPDPGPGHGDRTAPSSRSVAGAPFTDAGLVLDALRLRQRRLASTLRSVRRPRRAVDAHPASNAVEAGGRLLSIAARRRRRPDHPSPLAVPGAGEARVLFREVSLSEVRDLARSLGATVNDVLLSTLTAGLRRWCLEEGFPLTDMPCSVVVRIEHRAQRGESNPTARVFLDLPLPEEDPLRRIRLLAARTNGFKVSGEAELVKRVEDLSAHLPKGWQQRVMTYLYENERTDLLSLSNFPGVPVPIYLLGAPLTHVFPMATLLGTYRLTVLVTSVVDRLCISCVVSPRLAGTETIVGAMDRELELLATHHHHLQLIRSVPLFAPLTDHVQQELATGLETVVLDAGATVYRRGDPPEAFYILDHGSVEEVDPEGSVRSLEGPDFFGEVGLVAGTERRNTVRARTEVTLLALGRQRFLGSVMDDPVASRVALGLAAAARSGAR